MYSQVLVGGRTVALPGLWRWLELAGTAPGGLLCLLTRAWHRYKPTQECRGSQTPIPAGSGVRRRRAKSHIALVLEGAPVTAFLYGIRCP